MFDNIRTRLARFILPQSCHTNGTATNGSPFRDGDFLSFLDSSSLATKYNVNPKTAISIPPVWACVKIIAETLSTSMANAMERAYLNGDGSGKPFGIFDSTYIPTTRDAYVGTSATKLFDYDGLLEAEAMLAEADKQNAVWILSTNALKELRKLKDNNGALIFQDSMLNGESRRLLGYPIITSDRISENGVASGQYAGVLGNMKNYYIVDNTAMWLFVYNEKYQSNYAIGLQTDMFTGAGPVRADTFVRLVAGTKS